MKIIAGMKQIKELNRKADDLKLKVRDNCANYEHENPQYGANQREMIKGWLQAHSDIMKEIARLKVAIAKTNLATEVIIELDGVKVTTTLHEWIVRRGQGKSIPGLANQEYAMWSMLTDRSLKEEKMMTSTGVIEKKIVRHFDPAERDRMRELYRSEPTIIDSTLETVNATTDLIE
jgi:hypothetical protein